MAEGRTRPGRAAAAALALLALAAAAPAMPQPARLDEWVTARSDHFELHSDAGPERALEVIESLEVFRAVFAGLAPALELEPAAPTRIFVFRDAASHDPYKTASDAAGATILGQFLAHRDGNWLTLNGDPRHLGAMAVVLHEYVHYLVKSNFPRVPLWFHEGLAEYYSTFALERGRAIVGRPVARHLRWLAENADLDLEAVLATPARGGAHARPGEAGRFYAVSWGLVHYLLSTGENAGRLAELFLAAAGDDDPVGTFETIFGVRAGELEGELRRYLLAARLPVASLELGALPPAGEVVAAAARPGEVLVGLGHLLARMGRESDADRHFDLAARYRPDDPEARAGAAYLLDLQGRLGEAAALYREALADERASPLAHLLYGRHLLRRAAEAARRGEPEGAPAERAREVLARGLERAPGFAELAAELGRAHLFAGGRPAAGLPHLERAAARLPGRDDVIFDLVQLELAAGRPRAAERTVRARLAPVAPAETVARAEEAIERWELLDASHRALAAGRPREALEHLDRAVSATSDPHLRRRLEERLGALRRLYGLAP